MEKSIKISGIIMASGFSSRMGDDKLLMEIGGVPIVQRVMSAALQSKLSKTVIVCRRREVSKLAENMGVEAVRNESAHKGQSESIKAGIRALEEYKFDGHMFIQADMPFLKSGIIDMLVQKSIENPTSIIVPTYGGRRKSPVVFPKDLEEELLNLQEDSGGRVVIKRHSERVVLVEVGCSICGRDIDTMDDYIELQRMENDIDV